MRSLFLRSLYYSFDSRGDVINPKLGQKGTKTCTSCTNGDRKMKANSKRKFEVKNSFLKPLSQNLEVLAPRGDVLAQKWVNKVQIGISCTNVDRKMKIKSKRYFEVNYSFKKQSSQNFEVLTQCGNVINSKLARKRAQTPISCTNGDGKMKIKI